MCDGSSTAAEREKTIGLERLGETRQAAAWALLCGSCPVRLPPRREEHINLVPISQVEGQTEGILSGKVCYVFSRSV